jgi:hypothetical protein
MRGDKNWTAVNEIEAKAWDDFDAAFLAWERDVLSKSLDDVCDMDLLERIEAFFAAHPDGWPVN